MKFAEYAGLLRRGYLCYVCIVFVNGVQYATGSLTERNNPAKLFRTKLKITVFLYVEKSLTSNLRHSFLLSFKIMYNIRGLSIKKIIFYDHSNKRQ
jgi:hypothetical protein